jgi:hypothetical protein
MINDTEDKLDATESNVRTVMKRSRSFPAVIATNGQFQTRNSTFTRFLKRIKIHWYVHRDAWSTQYYILVRKTFTIKEERAIYDIKNLDRPNPASKTAHLKFLPPL